MTCWKIWIFVIWISFVRSSPIHFVVLPNVLRLETEEVVSVTLLEAADGVTYKIYLQDFPGRRASFSETNITVQPGEAGMTRVKVSHSDIEEESGTSKFVYVVVETVGQIPHFMKEAKVLINESPGYIFIQTDKPTYTPDQAVYTRVMTLNENFRPVSWPVQVDIQNPDGMIISRKTVETTNLFATDVLKIPENPVYGNWTVTAKFMNGVEFCSLFFVSLVVVCLMSLCN